MAVLRKQFAKPRSSTRDGYHLFPVSQLLRSTLWILSYCCAAACPHVSEAQNVVCSGGFGSFKYGFTTGVVVSVGAVRNAKFAARSCGASLAFDKQDLVVEPQAWQVDVDAMGIDLGLGAPVVAFQIKKSESDPLVSYEIYSLNKPPRPIRTITGGNRYNAADTDLDSRIEVWTNDAGVVNNFENIPLTAFDFVPTIVMRFENGKLIDVSSEFQADFDHQVEKIQAEMDAPELNEFKVSDGKLLGSSSVTGDQSTRLIATKVKVLEFVWCYLYSDREQQAWDALGRMWPAEDFDRIRTAILDARARGMRSQVDGVAHPSPATILKKKHAMIYDQAAGSNRSVPVKDKPMSEVDTNPVQILLRRFPPANEIQVAESRVVMDLVVDAAGKVRSAKAEGKVEKAMVDASTGWKFIPAFKNGHPVASRWKLGLIPVQ